MNASRVLACLAFGLVSLSLSGCGSDDDESSDPLSVCKRLAKTECSKFYECYSADELADPGVQETVGTSQANCETKLIAEQCEGEKLACDDGKTYHGDNAEQCAKDFDAFSCSQFKTLGSSTDTPKSCDDICQ